jgi:hypothetical protein
VGPSGSVLAAVSMTLITVTCFFFSQWNEWSHFEKPYEVLLF